VTDDTCTSALDLETLLDYWLAELPSSRQSSVEEHLLACDACSSELARVVDLADAIRSVARSGSVRAVVSESFLDRVANEGLRLRQYRLGPGESVECTVTANDDVLVARLVADLSRTEHVDIAWYDAEGNEQERVRDVPVHGAMREIIWAQRIDDIRAIPASVLRARVLAVEGQSERVIGEYTFNHTPSPPE
jgi:anti-sigma factor RsiW